MWVDKKQLLNLFCIVYNFDRVNSLSSSCVDAHEACRLSINVHRSSVDFHEAHPGTVFTVM